MPWNAEDTLAFRSRLIAEAGHALDPPRRLGGRPYTIHTEAVGRRMEELAYGETYAAAGYLHDLVEDHQIRCEDGDTVWTFELLRERLEHPLADQVITLLRPITYPGWLLEKRRQFVECIGRKWTTRMSPESLAITMSKMEQRFRFLRRIHYSQALLASPASMPIALADKENNLVDIVAHYGAGLDALAILGQNPIDEIGYYQWFITMGKRRLPIDPGLHPMVESLEHNLMMLRDYVKR